MGSRKRSARQREIAAFKAGLGGMNDAFSREQERLSDISARHQAALREKACESKNRYASYDEAEENRAWCASQGKRGLSIYRCPYCDGWHLTSHPQK